MTAPFTVIVLCNNSKYFCSGVVVDLLWVLTAAHCFHDLVGKLTENDSSVMIIAGTERLSDAVVDIESGKAQIRRSKRVVIYDLYSWDQNFVNDIALIELTNQFETSEWVVPAVLNGSGDSEVILVLPNSHGVEEVNWPCSSYGYGAAGNIKRQDLVVNKHCHCFEWVRSYKSPVDILRHRNIFMCDHYDSTTTKALSAGDSGSPLVCSGGLRAIGVAVFHYSIRGDCMIMNDRESVNSEYMSVFVDLCYFGEWLHSLVWSYPVLDELCAVVDY
ncbi:trypsin-2-like [Macrosteles quadrilineatus]|uniref:trypsin-2-like n=1 Tax=Macrosteles quadrilineatus TaxID=74068 RepID=UPI0023E18506|nr:trypsin-2-like [Macrosteles quadrilineatus]